MIRKSNDVREKEWRQQFLIRKNQSLVFSQLERKITQDLRYSFWKPLLVIRFSQQYIIIPMLLKLTPNEVTTLFPPGGEDEVSALHHSFEFILGHIYM